MTKDITKKDKEVWENFIESKEKLPNKDLEKQNKISFKTRTIDLHGFTLEQANNTIENFINDAFNHKVNKLIVVTGKGIHSENEKDPYVSKDLGILKYSVPEFINSDQDLIDKILEIKNADIEDGGDGAFYIFLRKKNK